jgi:hypothetical protein
VSLIYQPPQVFCLLSVWMWGCFLLVSFWGRLPWNVLAEQFCWPFIGVIIIYAIDVKQGSASNSPLTWTIFH